MKGTINKVPTEQKEQPYYIFLLLDAFTCTHCRVETFSREQHLQYQYVVHTLRHYVIQQYLGSLKERSPHVRLQRSHMISPSNFEQSIGIH